VSIDGNDPDALAALAHETAFVSGDFDTAIEMVGRAIALNPNSARAWRDRGWIYRYAGQAEEAVRSFERAIRLSPLDPMLFIVLTGMGLAFIELGRFREAVVVARRALRQNQTYPATRRCLAASLAHLGYDAEAKEAVVQLLRLDPNFSLSQFVVRGGQLHASLFIEGLRKAGLPE